MHLIDKLDGAIDGIPEILLAKQYTIPWIDLIEQKIKEIAENKSDINPYRGTRKIEFFLQSPVNTFLRSKIII